MWTAMRELRCHSIPFIRVSHCVSCIARAVCHVYPLPVYVCVQVFLCSWSRLGRDRSLGPSHGPAMVTVRSRDGHGMASRPTQHVEDWLDGWGVRRPDGRKGRSLHVQRTPRSTLHAPRSTLHAPRSTSPLRPTPTPPPSGGHGDTGTPRRSPHAHHPHTHPNPTHRLPVQTDVPPLPHSQKPSQKPAKASKKLAKTGRRTQPSPS